MFVSPETKGVERHTNDDHSGKDVVRNLEEASLRSWSLRGLQCPSGVRVGGWDPYLPIRESGPTKGTIDLSVQGR